MINAAMRVGGIATSLLFIFHIIFVRLIDTSFMEQSEDPAINLSSYGFLWSMGIQYR